MTKWVSSFEAHKSNKLTYFWRCQVTNFCIKYIHFTTFVHDFLGSGLVSILLLLNLGLFHKLFRFFCSFLLPLLTFILLLFLSWGQRLFFGVWLGLAFDVLLEALRIFLDLVEHTLSGLVLDIQALCETTGIASALEFFLPLNGVGDFRVVAFGAENVLLYEPVKMG